MLKLLNTKEFCKDLQEVKTSKPFEKNHLHPEGLYSEQIFGPVKNYTCWCEYHGLVKENEICPICKIKIINSKSRRKTFGKIVLPIQIINPIMYDLICSIGGKKFQDIIDEVIYKENVFLYEDDENNFCTTNDLTSIPENIKYYETTDAVYFMMNEILKNFSEEEELDQRWKIVYDNLDSLVINEIIVLPPDLRPLSKGSKQHISDEINIFYTKILNKKELIESTIVDVMKDKKLYYTYFSQLQKYVNELYENVLKRISKKKGLIRHNILGKRIDFSGRAIITPEPSMELNECKLPYLMFLELYKIRIAKKLLELRYFIILNNAIDYIDDCIDKENFSLYKLCESIVKEEELYCMLNRQPSLHRLSILGFRVGICKENVIKIHPLVTTPYNADFDGDSLDSQIKIRTLGKNIEQNKELIMEMSEIEKNNLFEYKEEKTKENGIKVTKYTPKEELEILSINIQTGNKEYKKITEFSKHENIKMYKIESQQNKFDTFWSSEDHSLIVYDESLQEIRKISPKELLIHPENKYLIQEKELN